VVDAQDQRAAALVVVDEMELPARAARVERRRREARHQRLQLALARGGRQRRVHDVPVEVELEVGVPEREPGDLDRPLPEAAEHEEALVDHALEPREVEAARGR
jgi:hypothetical protein